MGPSIDCDSADSNTIEVQRGHCLRNHSSRGSRFGQFKRDEFILFVPRKLPLISYERATSEGERVGAGGTLRQKDWRHRARGACGTTNGRRYKPTSHLVPKRYWLYAALTEAMAATALSP